MTSTPQAPRPPATPNAPAAGDQPPDLMRALLDSVRAARARRTPAADVTAGFLPSPAMDAHDRPPKGAGDPSVGSGTPRLSWPHEPDAHNQDQDPDLVQCSCGYRRGLPPARIFPVVDETLPHQIVLRQDGVTCNCRRVPATGGGSDGWEFFAPLGTADEALTAYADPGNHRGAFP